MSFIAKHITDEGERLIYLSRLHWIYLIDGIVWFAVFSLAGYLTQWVMVNYFDADLTRSQNVFGYDIGCPILFFKWMMVLFGFFVFLLHLIDHFCTEVALTSRRVIYKKGFITKEVEEIDLIEIRAEKVQHGILGSILGYGRLKLDSRFVGDIYLPAIHKPYKFLQVMHKTRSQVNEKL